MTARDLLTLLPQAPIGHLIGLPQVARQALFAAYDGPAVLLTTPERVAGYARLPSLGAPVSLNPSLEQWLGRADKVVLDVREALELFPRHLDDVVLHLELGKNYPRADLITRLEGLGYSLFDTESEKGNKGFYHLQGDSLEVWLEETWGIRAEFFGDELDTLRILGKQVGEAKSDTPPSSLVIPPAEGYLPKVAWDSTRLEASLGRVFLDAPEFFKDTLEIATELLWKKLQGREITSFGRTPLELPDSSVPFKTLPFYRAKLSDFARDIKSWTSSGYQVLMLLRHPRTGEYLEKETLNFLDTSGKTQEDKPEPLSPSRSPTVLDKAARLGAKIAPIGLVPPVGPVRFSPSLRWLERPFLAPGQVTFLGGNGEGGFEFPEQKLVMLSEDLLYGFQGGSALRSKKLAGRPVTDAVGLQIGDYLIHPEHGIGQFLGIETLEVLGVFRDYLSLQYKGDAKIRLPIELLPTLRRHPGTTDDPPSLSSLGKNEWIKAREKARINAEMLAQKLLVQYAARQVTPGNAFGPVPEWDTLVEKGFNFELTKDQITSLAEVQRDLEAPHPMDRLIAGDVGFGKTEVALRAAHRVIGHGKQVAILVPTTLLAEQHASTFMSRFRDLPVRVEGLSRFTSNKAAEDIVKGVRDGSVDLVIGTHRLLSGDIQFKNLGLIVIDEEHRFGVVQKERLKLLKSVGNLEATVQLTVEAPIPKAAAKRVKNIPKGKEGIAKEGIAKEILEVVQTTPSLKASLEQLQGQVSVDVLSLSATPIPRTLYMSMVGLRDLSSIQTPPKGRIPIRTVLSPFDPLTVRDAIMNELERGGKVFYIHDRVASIGARSIYLRRLVPEARVAVIHGQMREEEIEEIMLGFEGGAFDVLLSTTIVETGLDIPDANTILIERADRLGLAQLYQLRGRVGRRNLEAYAYLFYPPRLTANASRRLWAIADLHDLGSGHRLAEKDMEIRGVGNILGQEQHGHIQAVSIEVYTELLAQSVAKLKGETLREPAQVAIDLPLNARMTLEYFGDESERTLAYGQLSNISSLPALSRFERDMRKQFGPPPLEVRNFLGLAKLRILALNKRVLSIKDTMIDLEIVFAYKSLDYDAANLKRFPHKTTVQQFPPSVKLEKKGLKPEDYPLVLMDLLSYFG